MSLLLPTKTIKVNNISVCYAEAGEGETVILLHGFPENLQEWYAVMPLLAKQFHVVAPDMKGMGKTDGPEGDYSQKGMAKFLIDFMDSIGVDKAHIVGNDIFLSLAFEMTVTYPDRVLSLAVGDGNIYPDMPISFEIKALKNKTLGGMMGITPSSLGLWWTYVRANSKKIPQEIYRDILADFNTKKVKRRGPQIFNAFGKYNKEVVVKLHTVKQPVLIFWGAKDPFVPVATAYKLQKNLPHAKLSIFHDSGHFAMHDNPLLFAHTITQNFQDP